jgi:hypothetical protein
VWAWGEELRVGAGARRALEAAPMEWCRENCFWALEARSRRGPSDVGLDVGVWEGSRKESWWSRSGAQSPERKRATRLRMAWEKDSGFSKGARMSPS